MGLKMREIGFQRTYIFKIFRGSMPPDPPRKVRLRCTITFSITYEHPLENLSYAPEMYIVGSDMSIMCTNMEKEGNSALKWYKDNYLLSNPEKLNAIGIKRRNETEQINIKIGDQAIKTTDNIKLLGVNFDENLIFSQHISELCKKASQRVGVLARLRNLITTKAKLLLIVHITYLTYCHLTWHFCKASDTRKVERIQERALRIVYNSHSETYMNLLDCAKLPSLLNRRLQDIVILMYKVKYRLVPDFICDIFSTKSCKYNFRNQNFDIPRCNSVLYGKHSLRYLGPFLWNKLDKNITETNSPSRFKFHIRCRDLTELINGNNCSACVRKACQH